jgi:hypothetical protein
MFRISLACLLGALFAGCSPQAVADSAGRDHVHESGHFTELRGDYTAGEPRWWKGNTHTHSWWSDGDSPPELVAAWYREHDYDFLVLSDHNQMQAGALTRSHGGVIKYPSFWYTVDREDKQRALEIYRRRFGDDWAQTRRNDEGETEVRLKTLDEFRHLFEAAGEFVFVPGEEITTRVLKAPAVHMNGINLQRELQPRGGDSVTEVIQNNLEAVLDQSRETGREMIAHVNHPNFRYAITAEDLIALRFERGEGFFELYNGHHGVNNYGDDYRIGTGRMWDIVLSKRIAEGKALLYAVANDDAHSFQSWEPEQHSNPGRGWVMVRARRLTPDSIVAAMKRGDFYNSTGVTLAELRRDGDTLALRVAAEEGVDYTITFIGTRADADLDSRPPPQLPEDATGRIGRRYSEDIGVVLKEVAGTEASYRLRGDELYVRARITSSKPHPHGHKADDVEMAWTQPLVAPRAR